MLILTVSSMVLNLPFKLVAALPAIRAERYNMNNDEIINNVAISIYGKDEVDEMLARGMDIPVHTASGWKMRGAYKVKEGEKPIQTKLWKMRSGASPSDSNEPDAQKPRFYLSKAYLYCREQVELCEV